MATAAKMGGVAELSATKRALLEQRMRAVKAVSVDCVVPRMRGGSTPASPEQARLWMHAMMEPEVPLYNESITVHRRGAFDLGVLEASLNEMVRRHEIWRTSFAPDAAALGELMQVIAPELCLRLDVLDLSHLGQAEREAEACLVATEDAAVPFDMMKVPLLRVRVLRMADDEHWLQLTLHHIVFDGVSIHRTFVPELAAVYAAFAAGETSPLREPPLQYADYALWRRRQVDGASVARQLEFWRHTLAGELPIARLPVDRPVQAAGAGHRGRMASFRLPEELVAALRVLGRTEGVSLYMTLLAGLKVLLFRYGGQEDVVVGGLADGRRRPELERVMGYFLATLAIRTRPRAELPFAEYLRDVREAVLSALAASEVPFSQVVAAVEPEREAGQHPIFQVFLAMQPEAEELPEGWSVAKTTVAEVAAKFDLHLEVEERGAEATVRFLYRADLFEAATIERMMGHWTTLLEGAARQPKCLLGELPLLTGAERELMLRVWNRTEAPVPSIRVHELIEARALLDPEAAAVESVETCWSYGELLRETDRLAARLREAGAGPGGLVAVCLERSPYLVAALLAVMKTGAAYLPLDPGTPPARRVMCLEDATPAVVLTQRSLREDLPAGKAAVVLLEEVLNAETDASGMTAAGGGMGDAAYVIHTSGSTGRPKAVEISHGALGNLLASMQREPGFTADDTLLAVTTVSFDIAGLELFLPLIAGGRVVIAPRAVALDPLLLAAKIERSGCTALQATPATWRGLLGSGWRGKPGLKVLCGGEAMTRDLADGLLGLGLEVWNVYGPTETTIWSTVERVRAGTGPVAVGWPIANTAAYVLDARQAPLPIGVPGELYLGGMGLANGYRGQPELTAERFVTVRGERLYRTGDYALFRADGRIEVQGRADNQVKVRGYRIELEDVEAALAAHPGVGMAAAKAWPDAAGGYRLSAYLVGRRRERPPDAGALREFLKTRVPEYMIPSDVVALAAMPLTANGKMDRKALLPPETRAERSAVAAPMSEAERRLAAVWAELLRVPTVGTEENFFELGGHSLLVARLQHRIAMEFGRRLPMAALYHAPTVARQAALLEVPAAALDCLRVLPIQPKGWQPPLFWLEPTPLISNLGEALGTERPLLGVTMTQADLDGLGASPDLRAMAGCYVASIVKAQPEGPCFLGGLCIGGILAYEVASQLMAAGRTVVSLVMLDAENPVFYRRFDTLAVEWGKLRFYGQRALRMGGAVMFLRRVGARLSRLLNMDRGAATEMSKVGGAVLRAALEYRPPVYAGDVLLLVPRDRPGVVNYLPGWKDVVRGRLQCRDVDGHHDELLTKAFVGGVAEGISGHLRQLSSGAR